MRKKLSFVLLYMFLTGCGAKPLGSSAKEGVSSNPVAMNASGGPAPAPALLSKVDLIAIPPKAQEADPLADEEPVEAFEKKVTNIFNPMMQNDRLVFMEQLKTHFFNRKRSTFDPVFLVFDEKMLGSEIKKITYFHQIEFNKSKKYFDPKWKELPRDEKSQRWELSLSDLFALSTLYELNAGDSVHQISFEIQFAHQETRKIEIFLRLEPLLPDLHLTMTRKEATTSPLKKLNMIAQGNWVISDGKLKNPSPYPLKIWFYANPKTRLTSNAQFIYHYYSAGKPGVADGEHAAWYRMGASVDSRAIRISNFKTGEVKILELRKGEVISWEMPPSYEVLIEWLIGPVDENQVCSMPTSEDHEHRLKLGGVTFTFRKFHEWSFEGATLEGEWGGEIYFSAPRVNEAEFLEYQLGESFFDPTAENYHSKPSAYLFDSLQAGLSQYYSVIGKGVREARAEKTACQGYLVTK